MFALTPRRSSMAPLARGEFPFGWMREEFPALFERLFTGWPILEMPEWPTGWRATTEETEKEVVFQFEMPGFEPAELNLELTGNRLMVEAEHKEADEKGKETPERAYARVKRVMTLPPEVEAEKAEAVLRNGVLEVRIPRKPEAVGRRIEVKT